MSITGRTRLAEYLRRTRLKQYELAGFLGITDAYLSQVLSGKRRPSLPIAVRIERETGVPVETWVDTRMSVSAKRGKRPSKTRNVNGSEIGASRS